MVSQAEISIADGPLDVTKVIKKRNIYFIKWSLKLKHIVFQPNEQQMVSVDEYAAKIIGRAGELSRVCVQLFEKLRGTAEFFQRALEMLGSDDEDLLKKIGELRVDLDRSLCEARSIHAEAKSLLLLSFFSHFNGICDFRCGKKPP
jgi:hypothetical protein